MTPRLINPMRNKQLNDPILIAAWPGMGHVAVSACYYLIAKLQMDVMAEYASSELFDVDHVSVESGLVLPFRYPKNQFFVWRNPDGGSDLLVFIGEAQPPLGRYNFCRKLIDFAQREGVKKIFTLAAMASDIGLTEESRVIGAAMDSDTLDLMKENDVSVLASGSISGMNGILLGVAAERNIPGGCLLGAMPQTFIGVPYPKASLAVLEKFSQITETDIDFDELNLEVERMQAHLTDALTQMRRLEQEHRLEDEESEYFEEDESFLPTDNEKLTAEEKSNLEQLFEAAQQNRGRAYELKRELDRLDVFREYEDRFLDLFKNMDGA